MTHLTESTLTDWLDGKLRQPPDESTFNDIARGFIAFENKALFFLLLYNIQEQSYRKLAETLMLYSQQFITTDDLALTIRRANQHYIINTEGPIPLEENEDDFDVFLWSQEYAAQFAIKLELTPTETHMFIDNSRDDPIVCAKWGKEEGKSSAASLRAVGQQINHSRYGFLHVIPSNLLPLEPNARAYSKANAVWMVDFSALVYREWDYVRAVAESWGIPVVDTIDHEKTHTQAVICANDDCVILCFRGTQKTVVRDWLTDISAGLRQFTVDGKELGHVHSGFYEAYQSVAPQIRRILDNLLEDDDKRPIFVTGHSLGAALAQLSALALHTHGYNIANVYPFGSPHVGNHVFRKHYDASIGRKSYLHMNRKDIVTTALGLLPLRRYAHAGLLHIRFPNDDHTMVIDDFEITTQDEREALEQLAIQWANEKSEDEIIEDVIAQMEDSEAYLHNRDIKQGVTGASYGENFLVGLINDHNIATYLFKTACSIIDDKFDALEIS